MTLPIFALPGGDGAYTLSAGGRTVVLPNTISSDDEPIDFVNYHEEIPGLDGLYSTRTPNFGGRSVTLTGFIMDDDMVSDIRKVVGFKRLTLIRDTRYLSVDVSSLSIRRWNADLYQLELELSSPNYYWRDATETTETGSPTSVTNSGELSIFPVIEVTAGVGGFTVATFAINSRIATYSGSVAEGAVLTIDCEQLTARVDGDNVLNGMNSSFFVNPPVLIPGANTITPSITGTATYEVRYYGRYL